MTGRSYAVVETHEKTCPFNPELTRAKEDVAKAREEVAREGDAKHGSRTPEPALRTCFSLPYGTICAWPYRPQRKRWSRALDHPNYSLKHPT